MFPKTSSVGSTMPAPSGLPVLPLDALLVLCPLAASTYPIGETVLALALVLVFTGRRLLRHRAIIGCARNRFFGSDGTGSQYVPLKMAVVALGRTDVGVAELTLHVHKRVAACEP